MLHATRSAPVHFGPFRFLPEERLLERDGIRISLGDRSLMILKVLIENSGSVVSKRELLDQVWQGTNIEESNLRFQMVALRKALGDGQAGARYISTIPGRGYCWVSPIHFSGHPQSLGLGHRVNDRSFYLPPRLTRMVGRQNSVDAVAAKLLSDRFVSIVGPAGAGKTTVALAAGHAVRDTFDGAVCFVDLSTLTDPTLVPSAIGAALGLSVRTHGALASLLTALPDERLLIILDSCEHVIDQVAIVAERIFEDKSFIHILATSREALHVEGEHVQTISSLDLPPEDTQSADEALTYSAVQLFASRVASADSEFVLSDAETPEVVAICRRLDGIALAIELAASRVPVFGIRGTAARLGERMETFWQGRRTAPSRHQTLSAALDWSHELLAPTEQIILRRLAIFTGSFSIDAIESVITDAALDRSRAIDATSRLVAKSLVSLQSSTTGTRYRLFDCTRLYAQGKLRDAGETTAFLSRHAEYYRSLLETSPDVDHSDDIGNIRAALNWAFGDGNDPALGSRLAAASAAVWMRLSLLTECRRWMERAVVYLGTLAKPSREELVIQAALGSALMFTAGLSCDAYSTWARTQRLARKLNDIDYQLAANLVLWAIQIRRPVYTDALQLADQCFAVAKQTRSAGPIAMARWMQGVTLHHLGQYDEARFHLLQAIDHDDEASRQDQIKRFGYDRHSDALAVVGNLFHQQGNPIEGSSLLRRAVTEARSIASAVPLCVALSWQAFTLIMAGDQQDAAEQCVDELRELAEKNRIESYGGLARCCSGLLLAERGMIDPAIEQLATGLTHLSSTRYQVFHPIMMGELARLNILSGRSLADCAALLDSSHMRLDADHWALAELLRLRGEIALLPDGEGSAAAETYFKQSIATARRQNAHQWELRTSQSLAVLLASQHREHEMAELRKSNTRATATARLPIMKFVAT